MDEGGAHLRRPRGRLHVERAKLDEGFHADRGALPEGPEVGLGPHTKPGQLLCPAPRRPRDLRRVRWARTIWAPGLLPLGPDGAALPDHQRALRQGLGARAEGGLPRRAAGPPRLLRRAERQCRSLWGCGLRAGLRGPVDPRGAHRRRWGHGGLVEQARLAPDPRHQGPQTPGAGRASEARGGGQRGAGAGRGQLPHLHPRHQLPRADDVARIWRHCVRRRPAGARVSQLLHAAGG
mmetsp:Transcript_24381/g.67014  ORF Transcript_24381/g.67014 Transcript_24381/m.67014 type:complete len:236 (+) Transcript_24381:379-1086(+)